MEYRDPVEAHRRATLMAFEAQARDGGNWAPQVILTDSEGMMEAHLICRDTEYKDVWIGSMTLATLALSYMIHPDTILVSLDAWMTELPPDGFADGKRVKDMPDAQEVLMFHAITRDGSFLWQHPYTRVGKKIVWAKDQGRADDAEGPIIDKMAGIMNMLNQGSLEHDDAETTLFRATLELAMEQLDGVLVLAGDHEHWVEGLTLTAQPFEVD